MTPKDIVTMIEILADFAVKGIHSDLHPTKMVPSQHNNPKLQKEIDENEQFWHDYLRRADTFVRDRAKQIFEDMGMNPHHIRNARNNVLMKVERTHELARAISSGEIKEERELISVLTRLIEVSNPLQEWEDGCKN